MIDTPNMDYGGLSPIIGQARPAATRGGSVRGRRVVAHHAQLVAVEVAEVGAVVVGMVVRTQARRPVVLAAGLALDNTFFAFLALVIFLGIAMWAGAHKTAGKMLDDRAQQISKDLNDARRLREEAQRKLEEEARKA